VTHGVCHKNALRAGRVRAYSRCNSISTIIVNRRSKTFNVPHPESSRALQNGIRIPSKPEDALLGGTLAMRVSTRMRRLGLTHYLRDFEHQGGIIVCEERKFIYMKAPRTGGTSIFRKVLEPQIPGIIHHKDTPERFADWKRRVNDEQLEDYFIFSFVRNPWDRIVSLAFYFKVPVAQFVQKFHQLRQTETIRLHSMPLYGYTHCSGTPFADFVGRFESLQTCFDRVCERIGLRPRHLPHQSKTKHLPYGRYYDSDTRNAVADFYADDIAAFDYRFEVA
jgi:chondroitin 4-sulfotransferase 11